MEVHARPRERWVEVLLADDCEEAQFAYDLMQSGRLAEATEELPLPFRGQFLFKLPNRPRPVGIRVARLEPTAEEQIAAAGQTSPGLRLLFSLEQPSGELLDELEQALRELPPAAEEELKASAGQHQDEFSRVRGMAHAQRILYATRAGQSGRAILMQQPNPLLLLYLCKNPLITLPEVIQITKLPSIDALVAEYIVKAMRSNPKWAISEELRLALCMNPKTPGGTALSLLKGLNSKNLSQMCKKGEVRGAIKQAALRILQERRA